MKIRILKCHGSGNDFFLINEYEALLFSEAERVNLSTFLCSRENTMGGADGVLFFQKSQCADGKMRIFNSDGSEAEICGNGLRCIGRFACEKLVLESVFIETLRGVSKVIKNGNIHEVVEAYQAELNTISFHTMDIPLSVTTQPLTAQSLPILSKQLKFTALSMPNPHLVAIVDTISDTELKNIGEQANTLFTKGINVNFCQIINDHSIFVRTYERGVGLTNSCGSGMSAASLVFYLQHNVLDQFIHVYNQGGFVQCQPRINHHSQYSVLLSGNATFMFSSIIEFEFSNLNQCVQSCGQVFVDEIQNYGRLMEYSKQMLEEIM